MKPYKIYLSHTIRGVNGDKATRQQIGYNISRAKEVAASLRKYFEAYLSFPVDLYVPAEHDEFVQLAYDLGYMSIDDILDIDCELIRKRDLLLVQGNNASSGMIEEIKFAQDINKPIVYLSWTVLNEARVDPILNYLKKHYCEIHKSFTLNQGGKVCLK